MSTLVAQTISNGTVSTSSANVIQGSAKAWVKYTGTTINASYNVSSVTNPGTGYYVINLTNALTDANYAPVIGTQNAVTNPGGNNIGEGGTNTSSVFYFAHYEGASRANAASASVALFR